MCLTIPKKVIFVKKGIVKMVPFRGIKEEKAKTIIKVRKDDWVLTQNGIIIEKLSSQQASEIFKLFNMK